MATFSSQDEDEFDETWSVTLTTENITPAMDFRKAGDYDKAIYFAEFQVSGERDE